MTDAHNVFIVSFTDEEIDMIRRSASLIGRKMTNVLHDYVIEEAERVIEDAVMVNEMAEEYERSEKDALWEDRQEYVL